MPYTGTVQNARTKKAQKFLKSARVLLENGDYDSCISRCYYAVFHASVALLETLGVKQEKWEHRFVLAEFNKQFVHRRKMFPSEISETMHTLFRQRREADYGRDEKPFKKAKRVLDKTSIIFHHIYSEFEHEKP